MDHLHSLAAVTVSEHPLDQLTVMRTSSPARRRCSPRLTAAGAQQKRAITFDDFAAVRAVSDPQPSPDGNPCSTPSASTDVAANKRTSTDLRRCLQPAERRAPFLRQPTCRRPKRAGRPTATTSPTSRRTSSGSPTRAARTRSSSHISTAARPARSGRPPAIASPSRRPSIPTARPTRATPRRTKPRPTTK